MLGVEHRGVPGESDVPAWAEDVVGVPAHGESDVGVPGRVEQDRGLAQVVAVHHIRVSIGDRGTQRVLVALGDRDVRVVFVGATVVSGLDGDHRHVVATGGEVAQFAFDIGLGQLWVFPHEDNNAAHWVTNSFTWFTGAASSARARRYWTTHSCIAGLADAHSQAPESACRISV